MKKSVITSSLALAALACAVQVVPAAPASTPAATGAAATAPKPAPVNVDIDVNRYPVAATIGTNESIPTVDLNRLVQSVVQDQPQLADSTDEARAALKKLRLDLLNNMIVQRLIYNQALLDARSKPTLLPNQQQMDTAVWNVKRNFANEADFLKWLNDENKTLDQLKEMLKRRFVIEAWKSDIATQIRVSDDDIRGYYNRNLPMFQIPDTVWARHIQFSFPKGEDGKTLPPDKINPQDKKALLQKAQAVLTKAKAANADFPALAADNSDDVLSKTRGGLLDVPEVNDQAQIESFRPITRDDKELVDAALFEVLFSAPVGKVYDKVVETRFGYHVVKIDTRQNGRTVPYTDVIDDIKPLVLQELAKAKIDARVKELRDKGNVVPKI